MSNNDPKISQQDEAPVSKKLPAEILGRASVRRQDRVEKQEKVAEQLKSSKQLGFGAKCLFFILIGLFVLVALLPFNAFLEKNFSLLLVTSVVLIVLGFCSQYVLSILEGDNDYFHPYSAWAVTIGVLALTLLDARIQSICVRWFSNQFFSLREMGVQIVFLAPNILVPLLVGLIYDSRTALGLGLVTTFLLSIGEAVRLDVPTDELMGLCVICIFLASLCSVCLASFKAPRLSNRRQLSRLIFHIGLLQTPLAVLIAVRLNFVGEESVPQVLVAVIISLLALYLELFISAIVAIDILRRPIENLTHRISALTLMRYVDTENPLLRRLAREAPGTYHHSTMVGDLVYDAAQAIGANALLARAGAYYHDIGKLEHPFYFTENQSGLDNPHDELAPDISRMLIMNHVKTGIEMARYHHFPEVLTRFIATHHGTTVLVWFQNKAKERLARLGQTGKNGGMITDFYRYPGPLPVSREESILMLADSVEAASRSMKVYDKAAIERLVRQIVKSKWLDGQLDKSELTNAERAIVVDSFTGTLIPLLHGRLPYPAQKK